MTEFEKAVIDRLARIETLLEEQTHRINKQDKLLEKQEKEIEELKEGENQRKGKAALLASISAVVGAIIASLVGKGW